MLSNGDAATQDNFNNAFMSKDADTGTTGKVDFQNITDADIGDGSIKTAGGGYVAKNWLVNKFFAALTGCGFKVISDIATTGALVDLAITAPITVLTDVALTSIRSITQANKIYGSLIMLKNMTGAPITIIHESAAATAGNRVTSGDGNNIALNNGATLILVYDTENLRWSAIGSAPQRAANVFTIGDNQASPLDITGAVFDGAVYRSVIIVWTAWRSASGGLTRVQTGQVILTYDGTDWAVTEGQSSSAYDAGLDFSIDTTAGVGQWQYTSDDNTGTYDANNSTLTWRISELVGV